MAKGITTQTLAGEATGDVVVSKDLFAQMKLPLACTEGDTIELPVAIHNRAVSEGRIEVTMKTTIGSRSIEQTETIEIDKKGIHQAVFAVDLKRPDEEGSQAVGDASFELTLVAGGRRDVVHRSIPLLPYGMQVFATAGGTATSDTIAWVEDPKGMPLAGRSMRILIGPTVERSLLDAVLGGAPGGRMGIWRTGSALETVTSDLMGALALGELLRHGEGSEDPAIQSLDRRLRDSLTWLVAQQREDGSWSWTGRGGEGNDFSTARAFWAISMARSAGYVMPDSTYDMALAYLRKRLGATGNTDYEIKTLLLHSLAVAGEGDFALANRLHRSRDELSAGALAYLALAFAEIVRYFEIVKERWPAYQSPFNEVLTIASAYGELGEFERSFLVYRAMAERSFLTESRLAGFLESQGEFVRSVDAMGRLLREYPPESYIANAIYALAQRVNAKASEASDDAELRAKKINRIDLIGRVSTMLDSFLTAYPDDPAADQAAFARAGALLEAKAFEAAADACGRYAHRYPKSQLLDAYWYVIGYCHFATGKHQKAMDMCRMVAANRILDKATGRIVESPNKWSAVFILGQIHHSLGQAAEAVREYRRVEDRFSDAKKSIEYFLRKDIALPEVSTFKPGEPVKLELAFRNIASCDQRVYRIDLMKFGLLKRNLAGISRINLSGIRPLHAATVELGDGEDYRDRTHQLQLTLKEEGVYLVVCRGDDLHASGLVLVTPLEVEVQTDSAEGQVRATVKNAITDRLVPDVHVKVIGSRNLDFVSGSTDLRGVFVANRIIGSPTVIARAGKNQYAFHRDTVNRSVFHRAPARSTSSLDLVTKQSGRLNVPRLDLAPPGDAEQRIHQALASRTEIHCVDEPLFEVMDYFQELHGITIKIDRRALEDLNVSIDEPVTMSISGVSLKSALRLILRDLDLAWIVRDEVLQITAMDVADEHTVTKVYPVGDLVVFGGDSDELLTDYDSLIDLITATVAPDTWEETTGGPGTLEPLTPGEKNLLVVRQTDDAHQEIARLLATIRGDGGAQVDQSYSLPGALTIEASPSGSSRGSAPKRRVSGEESDAASTDDLLLQRIMDANRRFQEQQMKQLDQMYKKGGAMGGMGGGMGAGGIFN